MRTICGAVILTIGFAAAGSGRTGGPPATSPGAAAPANTQGAEAAARLTLPEYEAIEKSIGEQYLTLEKQLAARQLDAAAKTAGKLAVAFGESEKFWAQNARGDAVKWTQEARKLAIEAGGAASAGDAAKATQTATKIQATCKQCHTFYRESDAAGGFRVKPAALSAK